MKTAKTDVVALGELLVDLTQYGLSPQGNPLYEANPGGAPANVLAMLRKLGRSCAFIGKVGSDRFGNMLAEALEEAGIGTACLLRDPELPTTLAVVSSLPGGDRDFSFYRKPGADVMLRADETDAALLKNCRIFHFGTLSLTAEPAASATREAVRIAKESGALISFDPNLRPPLWDSEESARAAIGWGLERCDVLKIADNELLFMTGESDPVKGAAVLKARFPNIRLLNVTSGAEGSRAFCGGASVFEPARREGGVVDTTGAGDTFCACVLNYVLEHGTEGLRPQDLSEMLRFANAAAYLVTTKKGAIRSMPEKEQVEKLLG